MKRLLIVSAGLLLQFSATSQVVRWTDERGVVHFSDRVPPNMRSKLEAVPIKSERLSESEKADAEIRLKKYKDVLGNQPDLPATPIIAVIPATPPQVRAVTKSSCDEQWARFTAAQACFGRYTNTNGSVKTEAFSYCPTVMQPEYCGSRSTRD